MVGKPTPTLLGRVRHIRNFFISVTPPLLPHPDPELLAPLPQTPAGKTKLGAVFLFCYKNMPRILGSLHVIHIYLHVIPRYLHSAFCEVVPSPVCKIRDRIKSRQIGQLHFHSEQRWLPIGRTFLNPAMETLPALEERKHN